MIKKIRVFMQSKEVKITIIASILILVAFTGYLKYIGLPATNSQNMFNDGVCAYEGGDYESAKELFTEADEIWVHDQAREYLVQIESQ